MQKFLEKAAAHIYQKHKNELGSVAVVLPNQRANLFLKKHFSNLLQEASWSPDFLSIEDFIREISGLKLIDNIDLLIELYEVHKEIEKDKAENLEIFMQWANTLLHDFNELDRYLIDAPALFDHLTDIQRIKYWDPREQGLTDFQKENLRFWGRLKDYYRLLQQRLLSSNMAYQGFSYKTAAEKIQKTFLEDKDFKKIYFIGFNALTSAEEKIIDFLLKDGIGEMLYDSDVYYMEDPLQEAGKFLRPKRKKDQENFQWVFNDFSDSSKTMHVNAMKGDIAQVKAVGNYLQKLPAAELSDTAVILADENLLLPLLESLPNNIDKANITMGLPLSATSLYLFFHDLFQLFLNVENLQSHSQRKAFYYKNLLRILESPIVKLFSKNDSSDILSKINKDKLFYLSSEKMAEFEISAEVSPLLDFANLQPVNLLKNVLNFIHVAKDQDFSDPLQSEYLFQFMKVFNRLEKLIEENPGTAINLKSIYSLFKEMASSSTVPFFGEPLRGMQIMGVLESRTLDFKNVIFLSLNEGVLPSGKSNNSFIPYDIKVEKGLPSYKEKDAIFAYHFYRILQRANKVELFYNSQAGDLGGGEESRFVKQLLQELPKKAPNSSIQEINLNPSLRRKTPQPIQIEKTDEIVQQIKKQLETGISPSAFSSFLTCPLDYYYRRILRLQPLEESEESLQANTFGSITHKALENLYSPFLQKFLKVEDIEAIRRNAENELRLAFAAQNLQIKTGKNHLAFQVALQYIRNFLAFEKKRIANSKDNVQLLVLEKRFERTIRMDLRGLGPIDVKLTGQVDRVDKVGNLIQIIDFKTGGMLDRELAIKTVDDILLPKYSKALQLAMYSILFSEQYPQNKICPSIFFLRLPSRGLVTFPDAGQGVEESFVESAIEVVEEGLFQLLNSTNPFYHSSDASYCQFCSDVVPQKRF